MAGQQQQQPPAWHSDVGVVTGTGGRRAPENLGRAALEELLDKLEADDNPSSMISHVAALNPHIRRLNNLPALSKRARARRRRAVALAILGSVLDEA